MEHSVLINHLRLVPTLLVGILLDLEASAKREGSIACRLIHAIV
jgi:hypothetical protein